MKDPRIDAYIEKSKPFAQPILKKLRRLIHKACPKVNESIKWGMPAFEYEGPLCSFAAFKEHAVFGFWKTSLIKDPEGYLQKHRAKGGEAMGNLGRVGSSKDLPPDEIMVDFIKQAMKLNTEGVIVKKKPAASKKEIPVPSEFIMLLKRNKKAKETFENLSPSHRREYLGWITEAKTDATRNKRMETAVEWMAEGKKRNWKYERKTS